MERAWVFDTLCVTVAEVDFLDPEIRLDPDARERGVRVEIRPTTSTPTGGTVYGSRPISLAPAICRVDLLESRPGAADRMHWHPMMRAGEPGDRTFDPTLAADPIRWLSSRLRQLDRLLNATRPTAATEHLGDVHQVADMADEILAAVRTGLDACRRPWPEVEHDERGMAVAVRASG